MTIAGGAAFTSRTLIFLPAIFLKNSSMVSSSTFSPVLILPWTMYSSYNAFHSVLSPEYICFTTRVPYACTKLEGYLN